VTYRTGGEPPAAATAWSSPASPHIPALDGVRGFAILLVILFHHTLMRQETLFDRLYVNLARLGWSGVDLFFVLSGFLITGLLVDSKGSPAYYRNFYIRRTLRIFPLYYAFLFHVLVICPWLWPDTELAAMARRSAEGRSDAWYWLYLSNFLFARDDTFGHPNLAITWSLAIEEQFYLVWPFVVALTRRIALAWTCGGLVVIAFALRVWVVAADANSIAAYVLPMCRMDALASGALVALAARSERWRSPSARAALFRRARVLTAAAGLAVLAIWYVEDPFDDDYWTEPIMQTAGFSALACGYAGLVALAAMGAGDSWVVRFFSLPALRTFGKYSYALYLFHVAVRRFIRDEYFPVASFSTLFGSPLPGQLLFYVVATAPALALAWVSWHLFEHQWLKLARRFPYARPPSIPPSS
jgi:peptidoglycan/LPS O-acetylase OafA/YrhL